MKQTIVLTRKEADDLLGSVWAWFCEFQNHTDDSWDETEYELLERIVNEHVEEEKEKK